MFRVLQHRAIEGDKPLHPAPAAMVAGISARAHFDLGFESCWRPAAASLPLFS
jgi:hypothetical protein